ncbi:MAG: hypothetical protein KUG71_07120 [Porticoccaceae bacterium]|nr:hypothetical protein [Porticoccaceae bacterium]
MVFKKTPVMDDGLDETIWTGISGDENRGLGGIAFTSVLPMPMPMAWKKV